MPAKCISSNRPHAYREKLSGSGRSWRMHLHRHEVLKSPTACDMLPVCIRLSQLPCYRNRMRHATHQALDPRLVHSLNFHDSTYQSIQSGQPSRSGLSKEKYNKRKPPIDDQRAHIIDLEKWNGTHRIPDYTAFEENISLKCILANTVP